MGPFGIKGEIRALFDSSLAPEEIIQQKIPLIVEKNNNTLTLTKMRLAPKGLALTFAEIPDRNIAEEYPKSALLVDVRYLPETDTDELLLDDLVGFKVYSENNKEIGEIIATHNFGASDILEIKHYETEKEVMIPDTEDLVLSLDEEKKYIIVSSAFNTYLNI